MDVIPTSHDLISCFAIDDVTEDYSERRATVNGLR